MFTYIILQEIYCRYYLYWWKCSHKHCPFDTSNPLTNPRFIICKLTHLGSTIPYTSLDKSKSSPCNWGHRDWYTCDSVYPLWDSIWVLYMFLYTTVKYGVLQKYSSSSQDSKILFVWSVLQHHIFRYMVAKTSTVCKCILRQLHTGFHSQIKVLMKRRKPGAKGLFAFFCETNRYEYNEDIT